ncbi:MAG TPA: phosphatidylglycerol lysyltransferase domain-containing protein [Streptosporangiaceae bacterium]|nr:phosphatidylglycerol lysyltransferase domain-containing protein [Streptosporangiaceae bacterium]
MTADLLEDQELSRPVPDGATEEGLAAAGFFVADLLRLDVRRGDRVLVVSDLHLAPVPSDTSTQAAEELSELLNGFHQPGMLVIAGDGFEMLAAAPDVAAILDSHPQFTDAVRRFAADRHHRVVLTPGNHDGQLAWDPDSVAVLRDRLGVTDVALACDLAVETGDGTALVRVMHGHQFDQYNTFDDPRSPVDTPLGHHIVRQVLPKLASRDHPGALLEGVRWCNGDPAAFLGSRLLYRMVAGWLWWLAVPFAAALVLRFLSFAPGVKPLLSHHAERWLVWFGILVVAIAVVAAVTGIATMLRVNRALADASVGDRGDASAHNATVRAEAARLISAGYAGLITGHTHEPELSQVDGGFYANTGCATEVVRGRKARFGLPAPFLGVRRLSMVELKVSGSGLSVSLSLAERPMGQPSLLERLVLAPERARPQTLEVVGHLPAGATWPISDRALMPWVRRRRVRRVAAFTLLTAGLLNVVFAFLWPVRWTRPVDHWLPFGIHPVSGITAVIGGLALAGVARGVRLGYRRAWLAALVLLLASTVDRLTKDVGLEGSIIACLFGLWLLLEHRHFRVSPFGPRRALGSVIMTSLVVVALAAGLDSYFLSGRETRDIVLAAVLGTVILVLATARPGRERRRTGEARARAFERARAIFDRYGGDTLDYFALRDDKSWLFSGDTVVAYSVINRIMLVSPDPIGPVDERLDAWSDAMDLADTNGWYICVLGASAPWLPIYRAAGLASVYMGDEAIVDCQTFSLKGKSMKSLRGAYNRMSKSGYHVAVMDALDASAELRAQLRDLATETRQGEAERGFSMTLSRMFDERDTGLLLAVCTDPEGKPVAFNQYVPASYVNGYSLDLMRRTSDPGAPNGLTDFVILETINWMAERGLNGLGLNFAVMRAVVAGENGSGPWRSAERSVFHRFSDSMQIESLWNFNKKYDPQWRPRYSVADDRAHLPRAGLAIARAESVSELPVVGRFMKPKTPAADTRPKELVS